MKAGFYRFRSPDNNWLVHLDENGNHNAKANTQDWGSKIDYFADTTEVILAYPRVTITNAPITGGRGKAEVERIRKEQMGASSQVEFKPGYYQLPDSKHLYAFFDRGRDHTAKANVQRVSSKAKPYYAFWQDLKRDFFDAFEIPGPLDAPYLLKQVEVLKKRFANAPKPEAPAPPPPIGMLAVDLGPLASKPLEEQMKSRLVKQAEEKLTQQVQRKLQAWPYNQALKFTLNNSQLEARWADKD